MRYELSVSLPLPPPGPPLYVSAYYNLEFYSTLAVFSSFCPTQIAQMLAVLVSKIARIDYPKEWYDFTVTSTSMFF